MKKGNLELLSPNKFFTLPKDEQLAVLADLRNSRGNTNESYAGIAQGPNDPSVLLSERLQGREAV